MASRGLSTVELDGIRATLSSGRQPRVVFTDAAGQIAGQTGHVVELRNPSDDEWVVVRFGHDELPFSPTDLAMPQRQSAARANRAAAAKPTRAEASPPKPARAETPAPTPARTEPPKPARAEAPAATNGHVVAPASVSTLRPVHDIPPQRQEASMPGSTTAPVDATAAPNGKPVTSSARPPRPVKVKAPPTLTVTLSYTDGDWFVGAQQGTKALARPYVINAAEALRMVSLLDVPGVHDAVGQIIAAERADANQHADRLRSELAQVEARLAALPAV
ncbi:MAG TPA: hypothetical protein VKB59_18620 [Micromonosporaceae bacterium]|nr:hypothetical protein [Micromonosporaceae bacterium]